MEYVRVYDDTVIFAGSSLYRDNIRPGTSPLPINIDALDRQVLQGSDPNDYASMGRPFGQRGADGEGHARGPHVVPIDPPAIRPHPANLRENAREVRPRVAARPGSRSSQP